MNKDVEIFKDKVNLPHEDGEWTLELFKEKFKVDIAYLNSESTVFDLIGLDIPLVNAFRRILIAEVPTIAIEYVYVQKNTSVLQDEVLSQRLGLIPLRADPDRLMWYNRQEDAEPSENDTLVLNLSVKCERNPSAPKDAVEPKDLYINSSVYAKQLEFEPQGSQSEWFPEGVSAAYPDILIAKLRPGQEIDVTMHCMLGTGADHAKFSPVATASYRLLPTIEILGDPITGDLAKKFQNCFPKGVVGIDNTGKAYIEDARRDTVSREVLRHPEFEGKVKLGRKHDHSIFSIESTGAMTPDILFLKSVRILKEKCLLLRRYDLR
ncbi:hypothetical protein CANCADRAFT_1035 [Tortispora caseinolytica NRRL Y-17796]|uniref:DNA-directed RNA polymerases I and III subunit RPAC1 n=1 Tax=Tortispora caseinolytica NRRL Y-17796 TaxID=767744 RepID=A0A1E4TL11_9ASCO|nr:hypothetical protein CANCADRAFT_1035 [Tortispora caseinolytica NRRL Y-17796]